MYKIMHWDLEVENHSWYGNVASPFNPDNYIVASGYRVDTVCDDGSVQLGTTQYVYYSSQQAFDAAPVEEWLPLDADVRILVAHNMQFECKWALSRGRDKFEAFLKAGGRVLCTAIAQYLISHQQELYPSLSETAVQHGGTPKVDGVKIYWEQGRLTSEIPKELLIEYLAGPSGDIDNTAISFYSQCQQLQAQGMMQMYYERCDAALAFAYCEFFGLYVDREVAEKNRLAQEADILKMQEQLHTLLPADFPEGAEFSWGSRFHLSALVYGGPVKYRTKVPYDPPQYVKADFYRSNMNQELVLVSEWDNYVKNESPNGAQLDMVRFASGKNKGLPKVFREDTTEEKLKYADTAYVLPGLVSVDRLPVGVKEKYVGKRAEFKGAQTLCDGVTPVYSTSGDALKGLKNFVPEVGIMVKLGALEKDTGTYYQREVLNADGSVKKVTGMMQYIGPDNIVHHSLNVTATVTGRLSSNSPNLQNLPRSDEDGDGEAKSRVKEMFTSRFGKGGKIIEVDYSALEVVMLCAMTKDTDLLNLLMANTDMHCYRLAFKLGEDYASVKNKCSDEKHPEHGKYKAMRSAIKPLSFADQYGASASGLAFNTGCSIEFAQEFQENEMKLFPISRGFRQVIVKEVERTGSEASAIHREQADNGTWRVYRRGYYQAPSMTCYSFRQMPTWDKDSRQEVMAYKPTQMANYPFQGEAGFMMSVSMGRICRWLLSKNWFDGQVCLINNVHDAVYMDAANETVAREAALGAKAIMEDAPKYLTALFPAYDMADVPFPAAAEMGDSMQEKFHVH